MHAFARARARCTVLEYGALVLSLCFTAKHTHTHTFEKLLHTDLSTEHSVLLLLRLRLPSFAMCIS